jgi:hypothetical protein
MKRLTPILVPLLLAGQSLFARDLPTSETPVGRLSLMIIDNVVTVSPDSGRLAFATKAGLITLQDKGVFNNASGTPIPDAPVEPGLPRNIRATVTLSIDERMVPEAERLTSPVFSPDSKHVAFAAMREKKWHVVVDNRTIARDADSLPANPVAFSPDSAHVACIVQKGDQFIVTMDDKAWPPIDAAGMGMLVFSPDSQHLAAVARVKANWVLFVDGQPLPTPRPLPATPPARRGGPVPPVPKYLDRIGQFTWRPDSAALGYYAAFTGSRWQVFSQTLDGAVVYQSPLCDAVLRESPIYSEDGRHLVFGRQTGKKWTIVTDTGEAPPSDAPPYEQLRAESIAWLIPAAPTSGGPGAQEPALLYLAQREKKWRLYINHQTSGEPFDAVVGNTFLLSPDRHHYAFAAIRSGKAVIVRDGAEIATHDTAGDSTFAFSPDSQHLAYAGCTGGAGGGVGGQWFVAVDGTKGSATFSGVARSPIAFSPDSRQIAFTALFPDKKWRLIVGKDGEYQSKPYDSFIKGADVRWGARQDPEGNPLISTLAISKKVGLRLEARVP